MDTVTRTDDKIDVLDGKVDALDTKVDALDTRVGVLEKKVDVGFARTDERFIAIDRQLEDLKTGQAQMEAKFDSKFDGLQRTFFQIGGGLIGTLIAGIVTLIALVLTH